MAINKKVLIVGSGGFLASHVAAVLRRQPGTLIIGFSRKPVADPALAANYTGLDSLSKEHPQFDEVYMLAAFIPYGRFNEPNKEFVDTNIGLVLKVSALYPAAKIIYASSVAVYGQVKDMPVLLDSPFVDPDLYGLSKLAAEAVVKNHDRFSVIRFSSLVGEGMKAPTFITLMTIAATAGTMTLYGDGSRLQNYIDTRDAAEMCVAAASQPVNLVALGVGQKSYSNKEIAGIIQQYTNAAIQFQGEDNSPSFVYDTAPSYHLLNYTPAYSIEQSIKEIIAGQ